MTDKQRKDKLEEAVRELKLTQDGFTTEKGTHWARAMPLINQVIKDLGVKEVPPLGPVKAGGKSMLLWECTHWTNGIGWPAFDDQGQPGTAIIAPEPVVVYDNTSGAQGGDAFYCRGLWTGMEYWVGHITSVPNQGARFVKGQKMTTISADHAVPHVHWAINAKPYIGKHLITHSDYTTGAPKIGVQLKAGIN